MEDQLLGTPVTGKLLGQLLSESGNLNIGGRQLISVEAKIVGENQGFTSKILRVTLAWSDPSAVLPKSVIVKVIGSAALGEMMQHLSKEEMDHLNEQLCHAHNIECTVYEMEGFNKVVQMPICYGKVRSVNNGLGIIVLEDLGDRGAAIPFTRWGMGVTDGQLDHILQALANLHAWSVNNTGWTRVIPSLKEFNVMAPVVESLVVLFPQSKQKYPDLFRGLDEANLNENINAEKYGELFGCDCKAKYNLPMVMSHGDVHVMNMLFEKKPDGSTGDNLVALLDWQVSHQGCAAEDLARVLVICLSTKQRREMKDKLIRRYVELFNSKISALENRITFEDMRRPVDDMFAFFGIMWTSAIVMFDKIREMMKGLDEEEMEALKQRIMDHNSANLNDAMEMVKW